jgi:Zn-dependent protease with chaperone function
MIRLGKPAAIVLAVPVLVTALALLGRANWEARWDPLLARWTAAQSAQPYAAILIRPTLATVCADARVAPRFAPCGTYNLFSTVIGFSALVGGAGIIFLGGLVVGGRWCRGSRARMVRLFRPALIGVTIGTAVLGVAHGLLAVVAIVVGAGAIWLEPVQRFSDSALLAAGAAGLGWALGMGSVAFSLIRRPKLSVVGQAVRPDEQPALAEVVRRVSAAAGAEPPDQIVVCLVPWLFVTEMPVTGLDRRVSGRTLCLSLPLARILSAGEFDALLAHEMAHYADGQAPFTSRVAAPLVHATRAMRELAGRSRGLRTIVTGPPLALLAVFLDEVSAGPNLEEGREESADEQAAAVAGRDALASGLVKMTAFAPAWHSVFALMQNAAYSGMQYVNVAAMFQQIALSSAGAERLIGVENMALGHPTDRHAALGQRLAALGTSVAEVAGAALTAAPDAPAASLVAGCEAIEERLSRAEHQMIVETGGRLAGR